MMDKRAQAAMEFLTTYGWALLVVLIIIAGLAYMGILNPDRYLPDRAELGPGLYVNAMGVNESDIVLFVQNGLGRTAYNFQINASQCANSDAISSPTNLVNDKISVIRISCEGPIVKSKFYSDLSTHYSFKVGSDFLLQTQLGDIRSSVVKEKPWL